MHGHRVADSYVAEYGADKARWERRVDACYAAEEPDARPTQPQVLGALDALVDESDVVINAAGSLPGDLHKLWRARSRDQYHLEYGYSCMGYEIPAAIGVKLAAPERNVWALVGDGTYLMMPTEIVTAVQEGVAIKVLLLQNHGYASIGGLSEETGGERYGTAYRYRAADGTFSGSRCPSTSPPTPRASACGCCARGPCASCARRSPRRVPPTLPLVSTWRPKRQTLCRARPGPGLVGCSCGRDRDPTVGGQGP